MRPQVPGGRRQALTPGFINDLSNVVRWFKGRSRRGGNGSNASFSDPSIIKVQNTSGVGIPQFGVLGIGSPFADPATSDESLAAFKANGVFVGELPAASHAGKFCVALEPIRNGAWGEAQLCGRVKVKLHVSEEDEDRPYTHADIFADDTTQLEAAHSGPALILWKETGNGTKWAEVLLGGGGGSCDDRNEIHQIQLFGSPTGGTFTLTLTVNGVASTITLNWNDNAAAVKTAVGAHAEVGTANLSVTGGPFPNATIQIEYIEDLAATAINPPTLNWASLTGGTGRGAIPSRPQSGFPNSL